MSIYQTFCHETLDAAGHLTDFTLHYPDSFNFGYDVVDAIAAAQPQKRALVWCAPQQETRVFSFADICRESNRYAQVFQEAGIQKGDRVMVVLKRHYEYWFTVVALHKLGAVLIPVTHMLTASDYAYRIQAAQVKAVVCTAQNQVPEKLHEALAEAGQALLLWTVQETAPGCRNLTEEAAQAPGSFPRVETQASDPMLLYFTSGTTGQPKGVIHDFTYPLAHIITAKYWQQAQDDGLHFTVAETGWGKASWGKIYGQWLVGSAVMVYDFDQFDPKQLTTIINRYGVTSFCAPPTVYRYLIRKEIPPMPSLRYATTAGELLAPEVFTRFTEKTGIPLAEGYGQTETTLLTANFCGSPPVPGSLGTPSPLYHLELRDRDNCPVPDGEIGEIVLVPPETGRQLGIFSGYLNDEESYHRVWRGGVYHTGDTAHRDQAGHFWFHGRFDDIIKSGGYRIGPYEVEHILAQHPAVLECSVIGIPDPLRGQAVKAVVVLNSGFEASKAIEKEIKDFCNSHLAEYKWVRLVEIVTEIPKTISGKIRTFELRQRAAQEYQTS